MPHRPVYFGSKRLGSAVSPPAAALKVHARFRREGQDVELDHIRSSLKVTPGAYTVDPEKLAEIIAAKFNPEEFTWASHTIRPHRWKIFPIHQSNDAVVLSARETVIASRILTLLADFSNEKWREARQSVLKAFYDAGQDGGDVS